MRRKNNADVNEGEIQNADNETTNIVENDVENIPQEKEIIGDKEIIAENLNDDEDESILLMSKYRELKNLWERMTKPLSL